MLFSLDYYMSKSFLHLILYVDNESLSQFKGMALLSTYSRFDKRLMPTLRLLLFMLTKCVCLDVSI